MYKNYNSMVVGRDTQLRKEKITNNLFSNKWLFSMMLLFGMLFTGLNADAQITVSYTTAGTYTWVCPPGVTSVTVTCQGGGGAGGGVNTTGVNRAGGGGGGGAFATATSISVTPGNSYTVVVGAGGAGVSAATGAAGGNSSFNTTTVVAAGGSGGLGHTAAAATAMAGGAGGSTGSSTGSTLWAGGNGGTSATTPTSGGGGGGAGSTGAGGNASTNTAGAAGTGSPVGGIGAAGLTSGNNPGNSATAVGGGGSGARAGSGSSTARAGGAGAAGQVRVTFASCQAIAYGSVPYSTSFETAWTGATGCQGLSSSDLPEMNWKSSIINNGGTANTNDIWHRSDYTGTDWTATATAPFNGAALFTGSGAYSARFNNYNSPSPTQGALDLYLNFSAAGTKTLSFDYIKPDTSSSILTILYSTDGGATFPNTLATLSTAQATWLNRTYNISSTSSTVVIRFLATSNFGSYDIGIDNVSVTIPVVPTITLSSNDVPAGNLAQNTTLTPIYSFAISPTSAAATLSGLKVTTTGTYLSADITNLKCYYQAGSTFNSGTATLLSTLSTPGIAGQKTFPSFIPQAIANGATGYIFITADVPCGATLGNTIAVNAVTGSDTTFSLGTGTGTPSAGNTQTVTTATINNVTALAASVLPTSSSISWTAPTGCVTEVMIVASTASNTGTPSGNGSAYTGSFTFGNGTALGNGFVVYKGSTSGQVITGLTFGTTYYYKVFTRFGSVWSSGVEISQTASYCVPSSTAATTYISNFTISGANTNLNNNSTYATNGYINNAPTISASQTAGNAVNYSITFVGGTVGLGIWVDWNQNGLFTDLGENVYNSNGFTTSGVLTYTGSFTVPLGATVGTTRMRVIADFNGGTPTSCVAATTARGEAEDYGFTVTAGVTPTIALADNTIAAGNLVQNTTLTPIYSFAISPTVANATLTGLKVTTTGTYASADVTNLKCYYQTGSTFNSGTATLLSTLTTPGIAGQKTFPSFVSQLIANGATGYIFITADVPCGATLGNAIAVNAVTGSDTTFAVGTATGTLTNGTTQTVSSAIINNVTGLAASVLTASSSVSWTAPTGCVAEVMIVAATASNTGTPTGDGSAYTANLAYGSGTALGNGFVVYKGSTSPQVITGLTNGTPYFYKVFTRFGSVWSSGVEISQTPVLTYCTSIGPASAGSDYITSFTTANGIANISNTSTYSTNGYGDFTAQSVSQVQGESITFSVASPGIANGSSFGVYVDWNQNGLFTDLGDTVYNAFSPQPTVNPTNINITVPPTATVGNTRMRVIVKNGTGATASCNPTAVSNSETEDYTFTVTAATTPTIALTDNIVATGNLVQNTTLRPIYSFAISPTVANATLSGLKVTTTGTYASADITNLKCYYQTSSTFNSGTATLLSTLTTPGIAGQKTFPSFVSQTIANGATGYIFITADVPCGATLANIIAVDAVTGSDTTFVLGTATGTLSAGNTQTVTTATINNVTALAASVASASSSVSWTAPTGCVTEVMIVAATASNTGTPTGNGSAYTSSSTYGNGTALGNGFVIYKGSTSPQVVTGLTNGTPYFYKVFTRFGSVWSTGVEVSQTPVVVQCTPTGSLDCASVDDYIANVSINTLNNTTTCNSGGYTLFPAAGALTTTLTAGDSYTLSFTSGTGTLTHGAGVWVDFNNDGDFDDANEFVLISNSILPSTTITTSLPIPSGAYIGNVRMRVRYAYNVTVTSAMACTMPAGEGETEDYTLTIVAGVPVFTAQASADWSVGSTWVGGVAPGAGDNALIPSGFNVTTDAAAANVCNKLTIASGGTLTSNAASLTVNNILVNNGTVAVGGGTINVTGVSAAGITNAGTFTLTSGAVNLGPSGGGNRTFTETGTLTVSGGDLNINGNLLFPTASIFNQSGGTINIDGNDGTSLGSVPITADLLAFGTSGTNYATGTVNVTGGNILIVDPHFSGTATATGGNALAFRAATAAGRSFGTAHTTTFGGSTGTNASTATYEFFVDGYVNNSQLLLGNVVVNGNGGTTSRRVQTDVLSGGGAMSVAGTLTINSNSELRDLTTAAIGLVLGGNITNNGTFTQLGTVALYLGTVSGTSNATKSVVATAQTISGSGVFRNSTSSPTAGFVSLTVNNSTNPGVTLSGVDLSFSGTLTFVLGNIATGSNKVIVNAGASVSGAANGTGYIQGNEQMNFALGTNVARTFEIGTNRYSPTTVTFASVTTAGNMVAFATNGDHPNLGTSGLRNDLSVNKYWTITNSGVVYNTAAVNLQWRAADADAFTAANLKLAKFVSPSTWTLPAISGTPTATSITSTNSITFASGLGSFAVAEACTVAAPTGTLNITNSTCASACTVSGGSIAIGTVSGPGGTLEYSTDNGITWSATLPTYNAPQTILASVVSTGGCRTASVTVGSTVAGSCTTPATPTGSLSITNSTCASLCTVSGGSIAIGLVSGPGGTLEYSTDNGLTWSSTLPSYDAPQTILASVINGGGCRSTSFQVGTTVAGTCTTPAAPTGSLSITNSTCASACTVSGGSIAIGSVSGAGGTLEYSTDNGLTWSSTLPSYDAPQTIVASVINAGGCRSTSTTVGSTVAGTCTTPATPTISADDTTTFCSGNSVNLTSSAGTGYLWSNGATTQSINVTATGNYTVQVSNASGCFSLASAPTSVTVTAQPQWFLDADGDHYYTGSAVPSCTSPGTGYTTSGILGGGDCNDGNGDIHPNAPEVCWNNIDDDCDSPIAILSEGCTPVVVNMTQSYHNTTLASLSTAVPAVAYTYPGTTNLKYRYSITNVTTNTTAPDIIQTSRYVTIPASIHLYGATYTIKVSAVINDEVVPFAGNTITVTGPTVQLITLSSVSCGATLASLTTTIAANAGLNATGYTFRIRLNDGSTTAEAGPFAYSQSGTRYVSANSFAGFPLQYSKSYKVSVQYTFTDPVTTLPVQSGYGSECTINTPAIPVTTIASPTEGFQVAGLNSGVTATSASYATAYQFRIRLASDNGPTPSYRYTAELPSRFSSLTAFGTPQLAYNTQYVVSVRYSVAAPGGPAWSGYGPDRTFKTPFFPVTNLVTSQCGLSGPTSLTQQLNIVPYPGYPHYMVLLEEVDGEDVLNSQEIEVSYSHFTLSQFSIAQIGKSYSVSVSIILNGNQGPYETACDINTIPAKTMTIATPFKAAAYPNPFANNFMLDVKTTSQSSVNLKVYDMLGRLIENKTVSVSDMQTTTIGDQYPSGVYNVIVSQDESVQTVRVVKR